MNRTQTQFQKLFLSATFCSLLFTLNAQNLQTVDATNNGPYTPQSLISNVFLGDGVEVTGISYNGKPEAVGYFSGGTQAVGIDRGIILTSGFAGKPTNAMGPMANGFQLASNANLSPATDANLDNISSAVLWDVAVYTISFIPTADTLRFRYCFASEEYPEYSCTAYNDIFGFFIQGPGYPTPTNIALVPGTNLPVAINNIHPWNTDHNPVPDPCPALNLQYYNDNDGSLVQPVYDGRTDVFTAMAVVTPCQQYTIKLAIADAGDYILDSGVFLEARSFGTTVLRVNVTTPGADGSIAEGCTPASITFSLSDPLPNNYQINISTFGSATPGVDFQSLPANMVIPAGQTQVTYPIQAFEDGQAEPLESIAFDVKTDACHRDTVYLTIRDNKMVAPLMQDTTLCSVGTPIQFNATVPLTTTQPATFSNTQDVPIPDDYPAVSSTINVSGVQPANLGPGVIRSVCMNISHGEDQDLDVFMISPGGQILELTTDNGGTGNNYTGTCFTPTAPTFINAPGPQAPASATPFTGSFLPEGAWSDLWNTTANHPTNGAWKLQATDDFFSTTGTLLDWSITFAPTYEINYQWAATPDIACLNCPMAVVSPTVSTTYAVTATDTYGCSVSEDVHVEIAALTANAAVATPISCFGNTNGIAAVNLNIPNGNTYQWNDPAAQSTPTAVNLGIGTYTVTVSNVGGCTATASVTLTQPALLELNATSQDALCFGQASGTAQAQAAGGTAPYQYLWNNGLAVPNPPALAMGTYTVTVTDANGCTDINTVSINQPNALQLGASQVKDVSCFNGADGRIDLTATGGTQPFAYQWSSGQSGAVATNLTAGNYTATLSDGNGCTITYQQTINQPTELTAFATPKAARCFGENNGELHLDAHGGTPSYSTVWQGPGSFTGNGPDLLQLYAGNYVATITDLNGCTKLLNSVVDEPADISLVLPEVSDTICFAASNGTATVMPSGGTAPFTFLWDANGQSGSTATGLSSQEYHVTVTDMNGCTETAKTRVPQKQELNTFAQSTLPNCHDGADGSATVQSAFYGVTPANLNSFNYVWNTTPIQTGVTANHLKGGHAYAVTISDADGCTAAYSLTVGNPQPVEAVITGSGEAKCHGEASGWAAANASGGTAPYTWLWGAGSTPADSIGRGLAAGINQVTMRDAHGCLDVVTVTIEEPEQIQVQILPTHVKCFGDHTGTAKATVSGGTSPYSYYWWNGAQTSDLREIESGLFGLTVTDANGCTSPALVEIEQPEAPVTADIEMYEPHCFGDHNGQIVFDPTGGTPPYRYALDDKPFNGSAIQIGLKAGVYQPKIIDGNGCLAELLPVEVTQKDKMSLDLGADIRILLGQDSQLLAQVLHYSGNYQLHWSPADSTWLSCLDCSNPSVYSLSYNHYFEAYATDSLGCRAEDGVLVSVDKPRKVFVPTAFSPNGDFINDLLLVHGQKTSKVLTFRIYDRWGEMVYEAKDFAFNDENTGWDGSFRGQPMDPGVYVWVLEVEYVDGATEVYKGDTTLIR